VRVTDIPATASEELNDRSQVLDEGRGTPGNNVKRYLAGALDVRTGLLTWIEGERKDSVLLGQLRAHYPRCPSGKAA
jgi:hypothetical protein